MFNRYSLSYCKIGHLISFLVPSVPPVFWFLNTGAAGGGVAGPVVMCHRQKHGSDRKKEPEDEFGKRFHPKPDERLDMWGTTK